MRWTKTSLLAFLLIVGLAVGSCRTIYVPGGTTTVNVKDSTIFHYVDSVRIHEATRYKEMGWLTDTARIKSSRGNIAWAVADTAGERLTLGLEEAPFEEKTRIIYKDRWNVRDSIVYEPYPVEVTKEKIVKHVPWIYRILSLFGFLSIIWFGIKTYLRFRKV